MIVEVELSDLSTDNYIELEKIRKDITHQLKDEILVTPKVKLVKERVSPSKRGKSRPSEGLKRQQVNIQIARCANMPTLCVIIRKWHISTLLINIRL